MCWNRAAAQGGKGGTTLRGSKLAEILIEDQDQEQLLVYMAVSNALSENCLIWESLLNLRLSVRALSESSRLLIFMHTANAYEKVQWS